MLFHLKITGFHQFSGPVPADFALLLLMTFLILVSMFIFLKLKESGYTRSTGMEDATRKSLAN